ncbi:DUF927 domain-containing protein [Streptomyces sp. V4I2]|uniref:DUF927 domain-containing protein n=1 Tax=Streptomyces sp. V4I2 TaxID=3042280 RepID=UPI0027835189|nr:DUF927 domain-containing protein [Streptomyces sp. V4I2]MDQ1041769.1 hypothetical protein [Streptomyces sp. V4I2]
MPTPAQTNKTTTADRPQGRPGPSIPMSSGSWAYSIGAGSYPRGVYLLGRGDDARWELVAPLPYVLEVVLRRGGDRKITIREFRLSIDAAGTMTILCNRDGLKTGIWMEQLDFGFAPLDDKVVKAAGTAISKLAEDAPRVEAVPSWTADGLQLPPGDVGPYGYGDTCGSEEQAREIWDRAGTILGEEGNENGALFMGVAIGGNFLAPFKLQAFICHTCGGSSGGKSSIMKLTVSAFGRVEDVMGNWNLAKVGNSEDLLRLGCLTNFRDEIGMMGRLTPREAEQIIFQLTEGAQRTRARQKGGGTDRTAKYKGVIMSTGNDSLLGMATEQEGLNVRVLELPNQMTADAPTSDELARLADLAYGWPLKWMRDEVTLEEAWNEIARAQRDLGVDRVTGPDARIGRNIAIGVAGAAVFERITRTEGTRANALKAGLELFQQQVTEMRETSMKQGDKLLAVISETFASKPSLFPSKTAYTSAALGPNALETVSEAYGCVYDEDGERRIAVFSNKLKAICAAADIVSPRTGLRDLRRDGLLVLEESNSRQGLTKREWLGDSIGYVYCYVIRRVRDQDPETFSAGPGEVAEDLPLAPMPTLDEHLRTPAERRPAAVEDTGPATVAKAVVPGQSVPASVVQEQPEPVPAPAAALAAPAAAPAAPAAPAAAAPARVQRSKAPGLSVWSASNGYLMEAAGAYTVAIEGDALTSFPALLALLRSVASTDDVTLVVGPDLRAAYGLAEECWPRVKGSVWERQGRKADREAAAEFQVPWRALVDAGWHQPFKAGESMHVMPMSVLQHAQHPGMTRVLIAEWLTEGAFPRDVDETELPGAPELAYRLHRFSELTGWTYSVSAARTALNELKRMLKSPTVRRKPRFVAESHRWPDYNYLNTWSRDLTEDERAMQRVHGFDGNKNYLPAYSDALVAVNDLERVMYPEFNPRMAGLWLITVPNWAHPLLPAPVLHAAPGEQTWVTTAIVKLYAEAGIEVEIQEALISEGTQYKAFRDFKDIVQRAFRELESGALDDARKPVDPEERAVYNALKGTFRTLHGKFQDSTQKTIARPDWGWAIRDAAWTGILRKAYKAGGIIPLSKDNRPTDNPRFPVKLDLDELIYPSNADTHDQDVPAGLVLGTGLGQFKAKTNVTVDEWLGA